LSSSHSNSSMMVRPTRRFVEWRFASDGYLSGCFGVFASNPAMRQFGNRPRPFASTTLSVLPPLIRG
jgi:hypothetical protein